MKNAVLILEAERVLLGPGTRASRQTTRWDKEAGTVTCHIVGPWTPCSAFLSVAVTGGKALLASAGHLSWPGK